MDSVQDGVAEDTKFVGSLLVACLAGPRTLKNKMDETSSNDHPEGDHTPALSGMHGADESDNEPITVGIPSQAPAFGDLLGIHQKFNDANEFVTCVKAWARVQGFTLLRTGNNFSEKKPHPVHGGRGAIMWRSTLYCTHKDQACSGRSTCEWHIKFS
ncbi:hypothetical protein H257_16850 [Aphanomyces astaci]|uniref:Uncharacterized protein n=1 Tax=Aphanomyces astaci TaxID=112090 RepID=W4FH30_APHAT|nr:hypothetical protein H257_16850 [Aphanomyces astaci]ETV66760.1 hypothetical protein H257_16850 [Aphanomyces astaci]|eukprot:XP_009843736.1 hypothetical protein H257_16850 [Aphanomyces astaci]